MKNRQLTGINGITDKKFLGFGKNVTVTGFVSFFMDVSSEMIYPLVSLFLANVFGVNKSVIGLIEGRQPSQRASASINVTWPRQIWA